MTKKHFIALADTIRGTQPHAVPHTDPDSRESAHWDDIACAERAHWERTVRAVADFCAAQNPRFDRERWVGYINGTCGKNGGKA